MPSPSMVQAEMEAEADALYEDDRLLADYRDPKYTPVIPERSVYIAGPMSGIEDFNRPAFDCVAASLRELGFTVVSPAELDDPEELKDLDPAVFDEESWRKFLARDVKIVSDPSIEAIVVLDGWRESQGAALEVHVARSLGKPIYSYPDLEPVKEPTKVKLPAEETVLEEAERLVGGDRGVDYGHPAEDFARSAAIMSTILGHEVKTEQVPLLMVAVKLSRVIQSPTKRDSIVDICGYARTYEMTMDRKGTPLR